MTLPFIDSKLLYIEVSDSMIYCRQLRSDSWLWKHRSYCIPSILLDNKFFTLHSWCLLWRNIASIQFPNMVALGMRLLSNTCFLQTDSGMTMPWYSANIWRLHKRDLILFLAKSTLKPSVRLICNCPSSLYRFMSVNLLYAFTIDDAWNNV